MDINNNIISNILNIIKLETEDYDKNFKILNIFYNNSISFDELKNKYKNVEIVNVQLNNANIIDINNSKDEKFDYIIIVDVIEKLINPNIFINNLKRNLKDNGSIICNVLNLMYREVIKEILNGRFTYSDIDIIDKNNLRFFTLQDIRIFFEREGYIIDPILAIIIDGNEEEKNFVDKICSITSPDYKLNFNAYSYMVNLKIREVKTLYDYIKKS